MEYLKLETRKIAATPELRAGEVTGTPLKLEGYAAKFGVESEVLRDKSVHSGPFVEVIAPTAFDRTLREQPDVRALYNHETSDVLGRTKSGTLTLRVDDVGLAFSVTLPDTQVGRDVRELVSRGDIDGCSFGFIVNEDEVIERPGLPAMRTLHDISLFEISPAVAFPAYLNTEVSLRSRANTDTEGAKPHRSPLREYVNRLLFLDGFFELD